MKLLGPICGLLELVEEDEKMVLALRKANGMVDEVLLYGCHKSTRKTSWSHGLSPMHLCWAILASSTSRR